MLIIQFPCMIIVCQAFFSEILSKHQKCFSFNLKEFKIYCNFPFEIVSLAEEISKFEHSQHFFKLQPFFMF